MTSDSAVSVDIPAYQVTSYIAQALDSVFGQTHPASEVIVVNDGCPDTVGLEKALLIAARLFDEQVGNYSEDFDLWLRVARSGGRIAYQRDPLVSNCSRPLQLARGALRVLDKLREQHDLTAAEGAALERRIAAIKAACFRRGREGLLLGGHCEQAYDQMKTSAHLRPVFKRRPAGLVLCFAPRLARRAVQQRDHFSRQTPA